jgi:tRNA (5-methylaminomethyl-2-thiouridylate)-methyltransferase
MKADPRHIAVLVSGGVDSSLALALTAQEAARTGASVRAFYLKIWLEDELAFLGACPWEEDLRYVRATTDALGVPLEVISLQKAYHDRVVAYAITELRAGRTPSPDLMCNSRIKFGAFLEAVGDDFDAVVTGHYARRVESSETIPELHRAPDPVKDQTYFLARLSPEQVRRAHFPVGHLMKADVRRLADLHQLPSRARPDSQGICFLGQIPYNDFVRAHLGDAPGPIVDRDTGRTLGEHRGLWFSTIGQRKGLGLGGGPWFVVDKDAATRTLYVAHATRAPDHERTTFEVEDVHWLGGVAPVLGDSGDPSSGDFRWTTKIRHGPQLLACAVSARADASSRLTVTLAAPEAGLAPGQFAIFYAGTRCLGSGIIA